MDTKGLDADSPTGTVRDMTIQTPPGPTPPGTTPPRPKPRRLVMVASMVVVILAAGVFAGLQMSTPETSDRTGPSSGEVLAAAGMESVAACADSDNRYGCLQIAVAAINTSELTVVDDFFSTVDNDVLGPHCYAAAELLGRNIFNSHGFAARTAGVPACETGFQHGLMASAAAAGMPLEDIARTCHDAVSVTKVPQRWTPSMMLTCLVGVGRGVAVTVDDLGSGKEVCERILAFDTTEEDGKRKGIDFCVRGVVNDLLTAESDVDQSIAECIALGGTRAYGCLSLGLRKPGAATVEKNLQLARACKTLESEYARYCDYALSDAIAERLTITRQPVEAEALTICSASDSCPSHYAKFILTVSWDPQYALETCALLGAEGRGEEVCRASVPDLVDAMISQGHLPADKSLTKTAAGQ